MGWVWALDLGTTALKLGRLGSDGRFQVVDRRAAPRLRNSPSGGRTSSIEGYRATAESLLARANPNGARTPLGLAVQRSSFLLWDLHTGKPLTPLISWQDTRARAWCAGRAETASRIMNVTGLPLSPHYAGPKLSNLLDARPNLREQAKAGKVLFGTLETYLIWYWSGARHHVTDLSLAARTLMVNQKSGDWDDELLDLYGVPRRLLPAICGPDHGWATDFGNFRIAAATADQTAGAFPFLTHFDRDLYLNVGTGTFILARSDKSAPAGYLNGLATSPVDGSAGRLWEAPINAGAALFSRRGPRHNLTEMIGLCARFPHYFCLAEAAGLGAPYWRPELGLASNGNQMDIAEPVRSALQMEAYFFRIRQVVDDFVAARAAERVILSGGLATLPGFAESLAAFLPIPLVRAVQRETTLWGAAWFAAGAGRIQEPKLELVSRAQGNLFSQTKYHAWKSWLNQLASR